MPKGIYKRSDQARKNNRLAQTGKMLSKDHKLKISKSLSIEAAVVSECNLSTFVLRIRIFKTITYIYIKTSLSFIYHITLRIY